MGMQGQNQKKMVSIKSINQSARVKNEPIADYKIGLMKIGLMSLLWILLLCVPLGCSATKVDRCNQLIAINNRTTESIQKLPGENLQPNDRFKKAADILDRSAQELQGLKLQDDKLAELQQQLTELYRQDSEHNRTLATAQNAKLLRTASEQIQKNSITQKNLVQAVNAYCQAAES